MHMYTLLHASIMSTLTRTHAHCTHLCSLTHTVHTQALFSVGSSHRGRMVGSGDGALSAPVEGNHAAHEAEHAAVQRALEAHPAAGV